MDSHKIWRSIVDSKYGLSPNVLWLTLPTAPLSGKGLCGRLDLPKLDLDGKLVGVTLSFFGKIFGLGNAVGPLSFGSYM